MNVLRVTAGFAAIFMVAACTTTDNSPESPAATSSPLAWQNCGDGLQCGKVEVPLDYAKPDGEKISIVVNRLPASGKKTGSLVVNPGGPGASGLDFVRDSGKLFGDDVRKSFDIVGFDPRGVGKSSPIRCLTGPQLDRFYETDTSPDDAAEQKILDNVSQEFATGCQKDSGKLLPYVGTKNAARDIDAIRAAVGDEKLTYYGASYGTYLGAWYAEQFPGNVRALVLDGAVDPALSAADINIEQAKGFETALNAFASSCIKKAACPLGNTTVEAAVDKVAALLTRTDRQPLSNTLDTRKITENLVAMGIALPLYDRNGWDALQQGLTMAFSGDGTLLLRFADLMTERQEDGTYKNQSEANMAVNCVDKHNPDVAGYEAEADQAEKSAPRFGEFIVWSTLPCAYWPVKPDSATQALKATGAPPIVVVGTTRDPATPYQWSKSLAAQLDSGVLLSYDGDGHTAYLQGPPCIRNAVDDYLLKATPPADGTTC